LRLFVEPPAFVAQHGDPRLVGDWRGGAAQDVERDKCRGGVGGDGAADGAKSAMQEMTERFRQWMHTRVFGMILPSPPQIASSQLRRSSAEPVERVDRGERIVDRRR